MTISEFRKDLAHQLDLAVKGESVTIERGGIVFVVQALVRQIPNSFPAGTPVANTPKRAEGDDDTVIIPMDSGL